MLAAAQPPMSESHNADATAASDALQSACPPKQVSAAELRAGEYLHVSFTRFLEGARPGLCPVRLGRSASTESKQSR